MPDQWMTAKPSEDAQRRTDIGTTRSPVDGEALADPLGDTLTDPLGSWTSASPSGPRGDGPRMGRPAWTAGTLPSGPRGEGPTIGRPTWLAATAKASGKPSHGGFLSKRGGFDEDYGVPSGALGDPAQAYRRAIERADEQFAEDSKGKDEYGLSEREHRERKLRNKKLKGKMGVLKKKDRRKAKRAASTEAKQWKQRIYAEQTEGMSPDQLMGEEGERLRRGVKRMGEGVEQRELERLGADKLSQMRAKQAYKADKEDDPDKARKKRNAKLKKELQADAKRMKLSKKKKGDKPSPYDAYWQDQYMRKREYPGGEKERGKILTKLDDKVENNNRKARNDMLKQGVKAKVKAGIIKPADADDEYKANKEASKDSKVQQADAQDRLRKKRNARLKKKLKKDGDTDQYNDQKEQSVEAIKEQKKKAAKAEAKAFNEALFAQLADDNGELGSNAFEYWSAYQVHNDDSRKKRNAKLKKFGTKEQYQREKMFDSEWKKDGTAGDVQDGLKAGGMVHKSGSKAFFKAYGKGVSGADDPFQENANGTDHFSVNGGSFSTVDPTAGMSSDEKADFLANNEMASVTLGGGVSQAKAITAAVGPVISIAAGAAGMAEAVNQRHADDFAVREMGKDGIYKNAMGISRGAIKGGKAGMKIAEVFVTNPATAQVIGEVLPIFKIATSMTKLVDSAVALNAARKRLSTLSKLRKENKKGNNIVVRQALKAVNTADLDLVAGEVMDSFLSAATIAGSIMNMVPGGQVVGGPVSAGVSVLKTVKGQASAIKESLAADRNFKNHRKVKKAWKGMDSGEADAEQRGEKYGKAILKTDLKYAVQALIHQAQEGDSEAVTYLEAFGITPGAYERTDNAKLRKLIFKRIGATEEPETYLQQWKGKLEGIAGLRYKIYAAGRGY